MRPKRRTTRNDVAKLARVSPAVVSYVVNNGPRPVAAATRRRVEEAIEELGYFPNEIARSLRCNASATLGLIVPDISNPIHAEVASGLQESASREGYLVLLSNSENDPTREQQLVEALRNRQVAGVAILPTQDSPAVLRPLHFAGVPVVVLDRILPNTHSIAIDGLEAGRLGTRHLLELGHRRIGILIERRERLAGCERLLGHCQTLADASLAYDGNLLVECESRVGSAYRATRSLLSLSRPPTAIFAHGDPMCLGALRAIREAGLRVPQDVSLVGYGNTEQAACFHPALTTVRFESREVGRLAATALLRAIHDQDRSSASITTLAVELVPRESTAPLSATVSTLA